MQYEQHGIKSTPQKGSVNSRKSGMFNIVSVATTRDCGLFGEYYRPLLY